MWCTSRYYIFSETWVWATGRVWQCVSASNAPINSLTCLGPHSIYPYTRINQSSFGQVYTWRSSDLSHFFPTITPSFHLFIFVKQYRSWTSRPFSHQLAISNALYLRRTSYGSFNIEAITLDQKLFAAFFGLSSAYKGWKPILKRTSNFMHGFQQPQLEVNLSHIHLPCPLTGVSWTDPLLLSSQSNKPS